MIDKRNENIEYHLADIITQRPHIITVCDKVLRLYPITLAKQLLLRWHIDALGINTKYLPTAEALRLAVKHRELCCDMLSIHATPNTYKDLFDYEERLRKREIFMGEDTKNLAGHLLTVLTYDKYEDVKRFLGLDKEKERKERVMEVKKKGGKNSISFGALSVFGRFIGQLKEMGFTTNEILYECSYSFLLLTLDDRLESVYLTDDELERLPALSAGAGVMDANDPDATQEILRSLSNRGLKI